MNDLQQIRFAVQSVKYAIVEMTKQGKTHLFYPKVYDGDVLPGPGILRKHILEVVMALQEIYRGRLAISRTPGGIVIDTLAL
jgi:hypothetical protein